MYYYAIFRKLRSVHHLCEQKYCSDKSFENPLCIFEVETTYLWLGPMCQIVLILEGCQNSSRAAICAVFFLVERSFPF